MSDVIMWLSVVVWMASSWLTHIIVCLKDGSWGFLVAGALLMPIAWIHGTGVWLGIW
jgi:hypothetical protein